MPACPVCEEVVDADEAAFTHHVNSHFDEQDGQAAGSAESLVPTHESDTACFVCGKDLSHLGETQRNGHVHECLDGNGQTTLTSEESDENSLKSFGPRRRKKHPRDSEWDSSFQGRGTGDSRKKGGHGVAQDKDSWWDPVTGQPEDAPVNFSPGVIPALHDMLTRSVASGFTLRAVLSSPCVHIKGAWGFDGTWGCGYRNAMMLVSALQLLPLSPYSSHFQEPGVRPIQGWVEKAWRAGYDPEGKEQLKGKLVGTSKWIGTTDLYAMFTSLGVPCTLYDFRKPQARDYPSSTPAHMILERWVRAYFDEDEPALSDVAIETFPVRLSSRLPLILQHQGHSRTIVGYELGPKGEVRLLLFDPGKTVPSDVRDAGLVYASTGRAQAPTASQATSTTTEQPPKRVAIRHGAAAAEPSDDSDVEVRPGGWVRRKVNKAKSKARKDPLQTSLQAFRTSTKKWGPTEYQVLAFTGGPVLDQTSRARRKHVTSVTVDA